MTEKIQRYRTEYVNLDLVDKKELATLETELAECKAENAHLQKRVEELEIIESIVNHRIGDDDYNIRLIDYLWKVAEWYVGNNWAQVSPIKRHWGEDMVKKVGPIIEPLRSQTDEPNR